MASGRERAEFEIRNSHAADFFDGMARLEKLVAKSIAARFGQRDDIPRRFLASQALDMRARRPSKAFDLGERKQRFQLQVIRLADAMRAQEQIRKIAIVGQEDKPRGVIFETAHGENALGNAVEQIAKRTAALGIAHRRDNLRGLMQQQVDALLRGPQEFACNFNVVARWIGFRAQFRDGGAIHGDQAGGDHLLRVAARRNSGARDNFL